MTKGEIMSKYKRLITELLNDSCEHMTAEEIFFKLRETQPGVALATVYNNLHALCLERSIRKISVSGEPDRYDKTSRPHAHLICEKCKKITDIEMKEFTELLEKKIGQSIDFYELNVYYNCKDCPSDAI